ncbi:MAG TPA: ribonuclease HII [Xanthobacteraceae bacterium]
MTRLPLAQIRRRFVIEARPLDTETEGALRADPRPGAKAILNAIARRRAENRSEGQRLRKLLQFENALWTAGVLHVAGVDEAGMSPLAGPVAAAAVIFAAGSRIPGIDDSKKLDAEARDKLAVEIKERAVAWSVAFAQVEEIDHINIYWAGLLAMRRAVEGLSLAPQHILLDARRLRDLQVPQQSIVKGDGRSLTIAAASILAKTARDALMHKLDADYPGYGFSKHKGYPVRAHLAALERLGASPIHRRSFAPVRAVLGLPPLPPWPNADALSEGIEKAEQAEPAPNIAASTRMLRLTRQSTNN